MQQLWLGLIRGAGSAKQSDSDQQVDVQVLVGTGVCSVRDWLAGPGQAGPAGSPCPTGMHCNHSAHAAEPEVKRPAKHGMARHSTAQHGTARTAQHLTPRRSASSARSAMSGRHSTAWSSTAQRLTPRRSASNARSAMSGRHSATAPRAMYLKFSSQAAPVGSER